MATTLKLPDSLWAATAVAGPDTPTLTDSITVDVAIVGAGFCGLRTALELAKAGTSVAVIDAGDIGWGASGRNGGQVNPIGHESPATVASRWHLPLEHDQVQRYVHFTTSAANGLFDLVREHNIDCDAEQNGWIRAAHGNKALPAFQAMFDGWQATGTPIRLLDHNELEQLSGTSAYTMGWLAKHGGSVQPLSYARGLARAALNAGAKIFTHSKAHSLQQTESGWRLRTAQGNVDADTVVLCANGYTDQLFKGLRETVVPVVSIQGATQPLTKAQIDTILPQRQTFADTRRVIFYFRKAADNRLVFGSAGNNPDKPGISDRQRLIKGLRTVYPQFPELDIDYIWGGRIAVTRDHLPHIHELAPGVITGLGCNGRGVAMASAMGQQLALWALQRNSETLGLPVSPMLKFPLHRFHRIGVRTTVWWSMFRDRLESRAQSS